ncbi:MAG: epoxyqueuosine reductase QueH [Lachnospiraceae bacterium]|nr:epoxyqueuosine reductase QueH [Lachnospiraceae bacterium]
MTSEKKNYQLEMEKTIKSLAGKKKLLLHSCCAPCSSATLERLYPYFDITVFYYNPNIYPPEEFNHRKEEQSRLLQEMKELEQKVGIVAPEFNDKEFYDAVKGLEHEPEGGKRCVECFKLRLEKSAKYAKEKGFDFFTTTLSISPHKNAQTLNKIGEEMARKYDISYLFSDFKKKNGYKRSIELSEEYGLYRQNYCGCVYSLNTIF